MNYRLRRKIKKPFFQSKKGILIEINNEFINLTGYSGNELIGKSLGEIGHMLKIDSQIYLDNIENEYSCYMFTKEYEERGVLITVELLETENEKIYFFQEKTNLRIENKFPVINKLLIDNQICVGIYSIPDLTLLKANQHYLDLLGKPFNKKETAIGKKASDFVYSWESSKCKEIWMNVINTGQSIFVKEIKELNQNWKDFYLDSKLIPVIEKGKVKYIALIVENVTEKVLLRESIEEQAKIIKQQNEKLEVIIENMSDGLITVGKDYNYTLLNHSAREFIYNSNSIKNVGDSLAYTKYYDSCGKLLQCEDLPESKVLRGKKVKDFRLTCKRPDGIYNFDISGSPIYDSKGDFTKGILIARNVTDMVKSEENLLLKAQLDFFNNMIESLQVGFVRYSYPEFKVIEINNKAYNHYLKKINPNVGPLSSIIGKNLFNLFNFTKDQKTKFKKNIQSIIDKKVNSNFDYAKIACEGEEKFVKLTHQPLIGLNGKIMEIIDISTDITKEVKEKNEMKKVFRIQEELFANVSHELKTPLNVIFSTNQLLELYLNNRMLEANKDKVSRDINIIKQNCYRLIKLINNIVDLSKIETGFFKLNLSNENIVEVTENIVQSVSEYINRKELSIIFDTNTEEKIIACDPEKIERIILNLISNAIKFTNPGGSIFVNVFDKGNTVEITVEDTGIGIEKKYLDSIFGRFQQVDKSLSRNAEGSGIGLSVVKSIVELHGGKISVDSEAGKGSIFKIELPGRTVETSKVIEKVNGMNNKIQMINVEFSDIYSA
ncbi:MAG: histidine kinase [Clostridiaceae bacterium]|jgi:signal transduction histidine kinase/PAS domain-containing protein|nr:histidine kinase [Clostridiaceae bacterium]